MNLFSNAKFNELVFQDVIRMNLLSFKTLETEQRGARMLSALYPIIDCILQ